MGNLSRAFASFLLITLGGCATQVPETAPQLTPAQADLVADGAQLCDLVRTHYVFLSGKEAAWERACADLPEQAASAGTGPERLGVLETLIDALYDPHVSFGANSGQSPRLVPSGNDYWIEAGQVSGVRSGSAAARAGLRPGDRVLAMDGQTLEAAIAERLRPAGIAPTTAQLDWAALAAAAGYRDRPHSVTILREGAEMILSLDAGSEALPEGPVTARMLPGRIGYVAFNNSLGEDETVMAFDLAMEGLRGARGWILDLRNTPGGGSTDIAEPVMGRFIGETSAYQLIRPMDEPDWYKTVLPYGDWTAEGPLAVLVGHWTGSMGEGMAIGFDGLRRGEVFGSDMAGLAGGVEDFTLERSGLTIRIPTYGLAHIDGTAREDWHPPHIVLADNGAGTDFALQAAIDWIDSHED
jgi:carboxyl-terminal processing protease